MPRIDPLSLLKCLSVLLGPTGGIKSKEEVHRLANLMTKFSKKLVSKCIYIQILKTTNAELLSQFMGAGGWNLIHMWLTDGILAKNWALIQELLELLLLCPVDIERLKSNNCPKLIKGLSKGGSHQTVSVLASRLVEQWLKIVKGEAAPNSVPAQISTSQQSLTMGQQQATVVSTGLTHQQIMDGLNQETCEAMENTTIQVQDLDLDNSNTSIVHESLLQQAQQQQQYQDQIHIQPVQLQIVNKTMPGQSQPTQIKKQSFVVVSSSASQHHHPPSVPVYKITIRDGKQVLTKVETDPTNITSIFNNESAKNVDINGEINEDNNIIVKNENNSTTIDEDCRTLNNDGVVSDAVSCEVKQDNCNDDSIQIDDVMTNVKNDDDDSDVNKDIVGSESNNKSSDKENRDSHKKDDKSSSSSSSSSSDKKSSSHHGSSKSSSKHSGSSSRSSSHKSSSHRSSSSKGSGSSSSSSKSSRDKDRHHSSSNKHSSSSSSSSSKPKSDREKEREKEKEKLKKDQAEKDKATLEKIQGQSLGSKFGKIPKKKPEDEKTSDPLRKSSTDSRDSSKENKDKSDSKKSSPTSQGVLEKKNISISIENRKNSQDAARPKTVKTFNSKFRSTGLEEEVKPPPPRTASKKTTSSTTDSKKIVPPKLPSLKRSSPLRETGASADKKAKLSLDSPVTPPPEEKKGAIKLIPPKPKPMVLQESDMFMDALTASTKNKEPRKRKRRTSISKDSDSKKSEGASSVSGDQASRDPSSPPSSSPLGGDERSPVPVKPEFKFYQDTLETDEDKEDKTQDDKDDESLDEKLKDRSIDDEDDERSRTPTCEDEVEDSKDPASPDDSEDSGRKETSSPVDEIRYVDGLRSVLLLQKRKGPKKSLKWKGELESVRYFELDETERVNVTKTFTDMKQMEKQNEREAFQMARKLSTEDTMEERTRWTALIPIDLPSALVESGKDSKEKDIQYAREKGILQALYFNRSMIPDSAAEPDEERHHVMTDPKIIPLDDLTGNKESEKDFTSMPWPEPKPHLTPTTPVVPNVHFPTFPQHNPVIPGLPIPPGALGMGPMPQQMPQAMMPPMNHMAGGVQDVGAGGWRTGDGKVVVPDVSMNNMNNMPGNMPTNFPPPGMDTSMMPPGMMPPPGMYNQQDGYPGMMPTEDGSFGHMPNNFQGPPMFGPGPNFQGGPPPPRGAGMNPMHAGNRGRGGPGWFRGGAGPMRGSWGGRGGGGGGWRGSGKQPPVCRQFSKNGYCRIGDKCQYLHPGVNCPPF